jgi:hypothetical protein
MNLKTTNTLKKPSQHLSYKISCKTHNLNQI